MVGTGVVICLERDADLHMAQLMPLPLTVSCSSKIQIGFTFLVPAHPGSPGKRAVKRLLLLLLFMWLMAFYEWFYYLTSLDVHYVRSGVQCWVAAADTGVHLWRCCRSYKGENVAPAARRLLGQDHWHGNAGRWGSEEIGWWNGPISLCRGCTGMLFCFIFI